MYIVLPHHVRSAHLTKVIGVLMHQPKQVLFLNDAPGRSGTQKGVGPAEPSGPKNDWHIKLEKEPHFTDWPASSPAETLTLNFQDREGQAFAWMFSRENEFEEGQCLYENDSALFRALGKRLCQFFGGAVSASNSDRSVLGDVLFQVPPEEAAFPPKATSQTADDRWHQFHTALFALKPLSSLELKAEEDAFQPPKEGPEVGLVERLARWESMDHAQHLDENLAQPSPRASRPRF